MKKHLFALNAHSTSKQNSRHVRADRLFATIRLWGVDVVKSISTEISLQEAQKRDSGASLYDFISEPLPPHNFGRIAAQSAKQVRG